MASRPFSDASSPAEIGSGAARLPQQADGGRREDGSLEEVHAGFEVGSAGLAIHGFTSF